MKGMSEDVQEGERAQGERKDEKERTENGVILGIVGKS